MMTPKACAHGHTLRVVGCVSCVLVFDREMPAVGLPVERKRAFELGDHVRSRRDEKLSGVVIGFGTIQWEDNDEVWLVYLVQIDGRENNTYTTGKPGPAVAVLQANQTVGKWEEPC